SPLGRDSLQKSLYWGKEDRMMKNLRQLLLPGAMAAAIASTPTIGDAQAAGEPKYAPAVPVKITTPDSVQTRIGTLRFHYGPDAATVQLAYDQLDFGRGVDAFLTGMSATSLNAMRTGFEDAGAKINRGMIVTDDKMDARSLFLTPNTLVVYVMLCIDLRDGPM